MYPFSMTPKIEGKRKTMWLKKKQISFYIETHDPFLGFYTYGVDLHKIKELEILMFNYGALLKGKIKVRKRENKTKPFKDHICWRALFFKSRGFYLMGEEKTEGSYLIFVKRIPFG